MPLTVWRGTTEDGVPVLVAVGFVQVADRDAHYLAIKMSKHKVLKEKTGFDKLG